jgi:thioredoxin-like negative regulator of GroEL
MFRAQLRDLPETVYGHALDHFLEVEPDADTAVALAERNRDLRPNGEARTQLARAYLKAGRLAEAAAELDAVAGTAWCSAQTERVAAEVARRR